jgi:hypothetical protein
MSPIMSAKAYANNEIAFLAWSLDQPIPNCLGFELTRIYTDTGEERALPAWVAFKGQRNEKWQAQNTSVWPIQKLFWRDLTVRKRRDATTRRPADLTVKYRIRPRVPVAAGLQSVIKIPKKTYTEKPLPTVLQAASRGAGGGPDPFLANVVVEESYTLAAIGRGEAPDTRRIEDGRKLLALEAADGTTIFMRSDRLLQEELARLYPKAVKDGQIDLSRFRDREAASRGLGDWIWQKVSALRLDRDTIIDLALDQASRPLRWRFAYRRRGGADGGSPRSTKQRANTRWRRWIVQSRVVYQRYAPVTHAPEPEKTVPAYACCHNSKACRAAQP